MSTRAALIAACHAAPRPSHQWEAAVRALGAARLAGFPAPKPSRATGLTRGELYHRLLRSHVFDADRADWQSRWYASPSSTSFEMLKAALERRKQAEKTAKQAT